MIVLGGGAADTELAHAFARSGARVTVEASSRLLPMEEPQTGGLLRSVFTREGIAVRVGTRAVRVRHDGRAFTVDREALTGQRVLVTVGPPRRPVRARDRRLRSQQGRPHHSGG